MNKLSKLTKVSTIALLFSFFALQGEGQNILNKQDMLDRFTFWYNEDWNWYKENIPFLETPDKEIDKTYYYRWELTTIHLIYGSPESGYASTEFISRPWWSGAFGTISCPVGHQLYDFRWLRNDKYFKDYSRFWFKTPGAQLHDYTNWLGDAIWQGYKVNRDFEFVHNLLNDLIHDYYQWEEERWVEEEGMFAWNGMRDGMETNINSRQTPEWFDGAPGYRPTLNSYMWAHANAIVNIAELVGDEEIVNEFTNKAEVIKNNFLEKNWDPSRNFFFHRFKNDEVTVEGDDTIKANTLTYETGKYAGSPHGRELHGYIPWYFNLPDEGYETAWKYLMDPEYFYADYGPTTVEQNDPLFHISEYCCQWSGNSWPFATTQTLKAMANLLNNYEQDYVTKEDYNKMIDIFTRTHRKDGQPFIAEAVHPHSGSWDGHDHIGHSEHYYHSSYVDLIINDLIGLKPKATDSILVNPLVPDDWDYFCLDDIMYHGRRVSIVWDRDGSKYNVGAGLQIFVDGVSIASSPNLEKLEAHIEYKPSKKSGRLVNYAVNNRGEYYPKAIASFPGIEHPVTDLNNGQYWYFPTTPNQWSNIYSEEDPDWCGIDFGDKRNIQTIKLYFVEDDESIKAPISYELEYWDGESWLKIPEQEREYPAPKARKANTINFSELKTSKVRAVFNTKEGYNVGVSEFEAWGEPHLPVSRPEPDMVETDNVAFHTVANASASFTSDFDNIEYINDGTVDPDRRWSAFESPNESDWVEIEFDETRSVHTAYIYFYCDEGGVQPPEHYKVQYWDGENWNDVRNAEKIPEDPLSNALNIYRFDEVKTEKIRVVMEHLSDEAFTGIYELELYGDN